MAKQSAGILLYRLTGNELEVLLVHPGGPFWAKKDKGAWSVPKGEFTDDEEPFVAAKREFGEELGCSAPNGEYIDLGSIKQSGGKMVYVWAVQGDLDPATVKSNTFRIEWPPKSGQEQAFPEVDKALWVTLDEAEVKLLKGQLPFLGTLIEKIGYVPKKSPQLPEQASLF